MDTGDRINHAYWNIVNGGIALHAALRDSTGVDAILLTELYDIAYDLRCRVGALRDAMNKQTPEPDIDDLHREAEEVPEASERSCRLHGGCFTPGDTDDCDEIKAAGNCAFKAKP